MSNVSKVNKINQTCLIKIAKRFGVDDRKQRILLSRLIQTAVSSLNRSYKLPKQRKPSHGEMLQELKKYEQANDELLKLSYLSSNSRISANEHIQALFQALTPAPLLEEFSDGLIEFREIIKLVRGRIVSDYSSAGGKPSGFNGGNVAIDHFIYQLCFSIIEAGGHYVFTRKCHTSPQYVGSILTDLEKYLPAGFPPPEDMGAIIERVGRRVLNERRDKAH